MRSTSTRLASGRSPREKVEWALDDPGFCGPILSLSRSQAATYFSAASGDRLSVYLTGSVGVPHLTFEGVGMLSAAPPAAFLLRPDASPRTSSGASREAGTLLGWKGVGVAVTVGDGEHSPPDHSGSADAGRSCRNDGGSFGCLRLSRVPARDPGANVMPADGRRQDLHADGPCTSTDGAIYVTRRRTREGRTPEERRRHRPIVGSPGDTRTMISRSWVPDVSEPRSRFGSAGHRIVAVAGGQPRPTRGALLPASRSSTRRGRDAAEIVASRHADRDRVRDGRRARLTGAPSSTRAARRVWTRSGRRSAARRRCPSTVADLSDRRSAVGDPVRRSR
jgi:hypothetical protein